MALFPDVVPFPFLRKHTHRNTLSTEKAGGMVAVRLWSFPTYLSKHVSLHVLFHYRYIVVVHMYSITPKTKPQAKDLNIHHHPILQIQHLV